MGDTVNLSQRLQQWAEGGETVLSEGTWAAKTVDVGPFTILEPALGQGRSTPVGGYKLPRANAGGWLMHVGGGPVSMLARNELRRRWITVVSVGLLLGLVGGIGIACLAGARRTSTVMSRHLRAGAPDLEVDPGSFSPDSDRAIRNLPGVLDADYWILYSAFKLRPNGQIDDRFAGALAFTTDGRYLETDRIAVAAGREISPLVPTR